MTAALDLDDWADLPSFGAVASRSAILPAYPLTQKTGRVTSHERTLPLNDDDGPKPVRQSGLAEDEPRPVAQSRFRRECFDTLQPSGQAWNVKGLWPRAGVCFVAGPSMSGKSFWTLDALTRVVRGEPVLGRKSKACGVLYVASEAPGGVRNRIKALREKTGPLGGAFEMIGQAPNLTNPDDIADLRAVLIESKAAMAGQGIRLGIVAIDTLSASIPGADENTAKDMSPVLSALQSLAHDLDLMILLVAHTGKDAERGLRGWSGLMANADGLIMLSAASEGQRSGTVEKVKDGLAGDRFGFELDVIDIGTDEDGDPVTTCVVRDTGTPGQNQVSRRVAPKMAMVLRCYHLCVDAGQFENVPATGGVPHGTKGVPRDKLRERMTAEGFTAGTENPESIRRSMNRTIDALIEKQTLRGNPSLVWEPLQ